MKAVLSAFWNLFHALAFYPLMIGGFMWLYFKSAHWGYGVAIIVAILIFDPIWRVMAKNIWRMLTSKK